jgi:ATP-dependent Clp protease adaptor protein ClpS
MPFLFSPTAAGGGFLESELIFQYYCALEALRCKASRGSRSVTQQPISEHVSENDELVQPPATVILFNDEVHTFEEVIGQLIKALRCDSSKAERLTWEVHNTGKSAVFEGPMGECVKISGVLEEIALHTQIQL